MTSQLNEMKAMVNFLVQNYQGELPHDFTMHHAPTVISKSSLNLYMFDTIIWKVINYHYFLC